MFFASFAGGCRSRCVSAGSPLGVSTATCGRQFVHGVHVVGQRQVRTVKPVRLPDWTRMWTCPLLCSTDAPYRRAENCGAPQLQFVDQVEPSLFGNRTGAHSATVQSSAAKGAVSWTAEGLFWEPCTQVQGRGGHVHRDMTPGISCIL